MTQYEAVIGLEIHIQLNTNSKIFCSCKADSWGAPPNTNICPVCTGQPGVLPVPNQAVIEKGILLASAMNSSVQKVSFFDRKNYFYPDLPKGYQISQYDLAIGMGGYMDLTLEDGTIRRISIEKMHIEEDAGKTIHETNRRLLDFNRCGVPLVEMVTGPDLRSADEAADFIQYLRQLVRWIDVSNANMEKGQLRFDGNVSIREKGSQKLNPKTEIKNVNSVEHIRDAINMEIKRQIKAVESGEKIESWTLDWDEDKQVLSKMRSKETEADYRYFREPDLLPIQLTKEMIEETLNKMPELPLERRERFISEYKLSPKEAKVLTGDRELSDYFESAVQAYSGEAKQIANRVINDLLGIINETGKTAGELNLSPVHLVQIQDLIDEEKINTSTGKQLFQKVEVSGDNPTEIVEREGLAQLTDTGKIQAICEKIITDNPEQVDAYRGGKQGLIGWFIGQTMASSGGKANPQTVRQIFVELLEN